MRQVASYVTLFRECFTIASPCNYVRCLDTWDFPHFNGRDLINGVPDTPPSGRLGLITLSVPLVIERLEKVFVSIKEVLNRIRFRIDERCRINKAIPREHKFRAECVAKVYRVRHLIGFCPQLLPCEQINGTIKHAQLVLDLLAWQKLRAETYQMPD